MDTINSFNNIKREDTNYMKKPITILDKSLNEELKRPIAFINTLDGLTSNTNLLKPIRTIKTDISKEHDEIISFLLEQYDMDIVNSYVENNQLYTDSGNNDICNISNAEFLAPKTTGTSSPSIVSNLSNNNEINLETKKSESNPDNSEAFLKPPILCNVVHATGEVNFYFDNSGTYAIEISENNTTKKIKICNFIVHPISIVVSDNGKYTREYYKIRCSISPNINSTVEFTMYDLKSKEDFMRKLDIKFTFSQETKSFEYFKMFIAKLMKSIATTYEYTHIGWRFIQGKWIYLTGSSAIGSNDPNLKGDKTKPLSFDLSLSKQTALVSSLEMLNISHNKSKTLPLFLYMHLGLMKTLFQSANIEPRFILWIYGLTNSLKTSVAKVFFNIFNEQNISASFKDTAAALEPKAFDYKDSVLLLDDYHPTANPEDKRNMEKIAQFIIRIYGDNIPKSRATKDMKKAKEYPPRGLCAITGEDIITGESSMSRLIGIEICPNDYNSDVLSVFQNNPVPYYTHIYYFIEWISNNANELLKFISDRFSTLRNLNKNKFSHRRYIDSFILFQITIEIFINYCKYCNQNLDYNKLHSEWTCIIAGLLEEQEKIIIQENPVYMFVHAIHVLVSTGRYSLTDVNYKEKQASNFIGYYDNEYWYICPTNIYKIITTYWDNQKRPFTSGYRAILKALDEEKIIKTSMEGSSLKRTLKIKGHKNNIRYIVIKLSKMQELLNI